VQVELMRLRTARASWSHAACREALQTAMKRKEPEAGPSDAAAAPAVKAARSHYDVLGGSGSSDSSSSDDS
jgi:hypothetical protein